MSSEVEICNLALSHLGDSATVASISPAEGSPQAQRCAVFYPIARDALLTLPWTFNTRRGALEELTVNEWPAWDYCYGKPNNCLKIHGITEENGVLNDPAEVDQYVLQINSSGTEVIYTNLANAWATYSVQITDTQRFTPPFVMALSYQLAGMLAGPLLKGQVGVQTAQQMIRMAEYWKGQASLADANQQNYPIEHQPSWISGRN